MEVIEKSKASKWLRFKDFLKGSRLHRQHGFFKAKTGEFIKGEGLFYHGFRLQIDEAPEPNDVNWEAINSTNYDKVTVRILTYFYAFLLLSFSFAVVFGIKYFQSSYLDEASEELEDEDEEIVAEAKEKIELVENLNYLVAFIIILFNKFFVGPLTDKIVE